MKTATKRLSGFHWMLMLLSVGYSGVMLHLSGDFLHHADGVAPYHLLQSQSLLEGHFSLGQSFSQLHPGLAWHNGQVQQVWGLGVALWLLPFQALWRLLGGYWFPDRLALGLAFALLALFAGQTGLRWARQGRIFLGIGFVWMILLSPPLWTLARDSQLVFEETVLYGLLLALGILVALIRAICFQSRFDFWLCCVLGALSGLVRPTLAVYGVGGVMVCCLIEYIRSRPLKPLLPGVCILLGGLAGLAASNQQRFGSPFEFGHRLTVSSESMIYLTRFGNPYQQASNPAAARELFSVLFLSPPIRDNNAFAGAWFSGQASETRWRRLNLTTFDLGYTAITTIAVIAFLWRLASRSRKELAEPQGCLILGLALWSGASFSALFIFYLHYPSISSRYLLDFLPALVGFVLLLWWQIPAKWHGVAVLFLAGWLLHGIATGQVATASPMDEPPAVGTKPPPDSALHSLDRTYTLASHPSQTGITLNGSGWDMQNGLADDVVILAMDHPQFVELNVSERLIQDSSPAQTDFYQADMGGQMLHLRKVEPEAGGLRVVFDVPDSIRQQNQDQILCVCFSQGYELADQESKRFLYSVRW